MKKAAVIGPCQAALIDAPEPRAAADWVVVKIHVAPMCTEYKAFVAGQRSEFLGHEAAGEVVEVAQPGRVQVGDRVVVMPLYACGSCALCVTGDYIHCEQPQRVSEVTGCAEGTATMAQYLVKPDWLLPRIPDDLSYEQGALACCALGPSFGAFDRMSVSAFDTVLITGAGPVGLGAVVNAAFRGARAFVVESLPYRMERARELGAEAVIPPGEEALAEIRQRTVDRGVDAALDCSGTVPAQRLCIDAVRRRGQVAFVGECGEPLAIRASPDLIRKGITLHGSWHYNMNLYPQVVEVIRRSPVVERLVSHVLPMSRIQEAMELSASRECAKILLKPWE